MEPSRRAFLTAGRVPASPWGRFRQRLARSVRGRVQDQTPAHDAPGTAWLAPARAEDVLHARALCAESGVALVLDGCPPRPGAPCLVIDPRPLHGLVVADDSVHAEPGVLVGELREHWPTACPGAAHDWTLARWLALEGGASRGAAWADTALDAVDLLLATGACETFGPFGAASRRPALSPAASRLVSDLFTLAGRREYAAWRGRSGWPGRYRLDVLLRETPNLAHLLVGSHGTLAWVAGLTFVRPSSADGFDAVQHAGAPAEPPPPDDVDRADAAIKLAFDGAGVFP